MSKSQGQKVKLGERLRKAFTLAGVKAAEVAKETGVSQAAVSTWLHSTREPKIKVLDVLYKKYRINPLYIISGEGPPLIPKVEGGKGEVGLLLAQGKKKLQRKRPYIKRQIGIS